MGRKTTARVTALMVAVNEELRALIARRNLSQRQLEAASGVSQSLISKTIFKEESVLNLSQFEAICGVLGVSPSVVLESAERAVLVSARPRPAARPVPTLAPEPAGHYNTAGEWIPVHRDGYTLAAYESNEEKGVDYIDG